MSSHLTDEQIAHLKSELNEQHKALREEIRAELLKSDDETYVELAGRVHDQGDESVADLVSDVNTAIIDSQIMAARAVEDALQRIAMGSYGRCVECGEAIPYERLEVEPAARRCINCQTRFERTHPQGRGSSL